MRKLKIIISIVLLSFVSLTSHAREVTLWNYYNFPPFVNNHSQGLVKETVDLLNDELNGEYFLKLKSVPRSRIARALKNAEQGAVVFVNWAWMGAKSKTRYLWTKPFLQDSNVIISANRSKVPFDSFQELQGLKFGAVLGRVYPSLESMFADGSLQRIDFNNEKEVLRVLAKGRIDFTTQPLSQFTGLSTTMNNRDKFYVSQQALFSYQRHIMVTDKLEGLAIALNTIISNLPTNPEWQRILEKNKLISQAVN